MAGKERDLKAQQPQVDQTATGSELRSRQGAFGSADGPLRRSFLVQVAAGCEAANGDLRGRVQQLATSDGGNFDSVDALLAILRRIFSDEQKNQNRNQEPETGGENQ